MYGILLCFRIAWSEENVRCQDAGQPTVEGILNKTALEFHLADFTIKPFPLKLTASTRFVQKYCA